MLAGTDARWQIHAIVSPSKQTRMHVFFAIFMNADRDITIDSRLHHASTVCMHISMCLNHCTSWEGVGSIGAVEYT